MNNKGLYNSLYLELLKKTLVDFRNIGSSELHPLPIVNANWKTAFLYPLDRLLRTRNFAITKLIPVHEDERMNGYDWPARAETMIGINRLSNIESCIRTVLSDNVPGDFLEAGVWRGGAAIFMRAVLKEQNITTRKVWLADSFRGLPAPSAQYKADKDSTLYKEKILSVNVQEVKRNFRHYDLLDEQVVFLEGWFKDTLPAAPVTQLALLRIDADMYESTTQVLENLYPKLSPGGFVIVDDYNAFPNCKKAVDDYREANNLQEKIVTIDKEAVYWRKVNL